MGLHSVVFHGVVAKPSLGFLTCSCTPPSAGQETEAPEGSQHHHNHDLISRPIAVPLPGQERSR